jgi:hypothetical protein
MQMKSFGLLQTSKVIATVYFIGGLLFAAIAAVLSVASGRPLRSGPNILLLPVLCGVLGFIYTAIFCWIYNLVAQWIGGIEVELSDQAR